VPEGPEIRRMVDDIQKAVGQCKADKVFFAFDRFKSFEPTLAGRLVTAVEARGKAVLVFFSALGNDGPWCVYSHNQLYGQWRMSKADAQPNTGRQLRFAIIGSDKAAWLYSASDIRLVRPDDLEQVEYLMRLGPDPVNQTISVEDVLVQFDDKRFRGRGLGGLLLDQGFVAGVGNYLRSEILFEAGLMPSVRPKDLSSEARERLAKAILVLIERAYRLKGITNDPERVKRLKREGRTFSQRRFMVFNRDSESCYACETAIVKISAASRRLYYCPLCQAG